MPKKIDWYYHRNGCTTCKRSQGFLESHGLKVAEQSDARKDRRSPDDALKLAKAADHIWVAKGKNMIHFQMKTDQPSDETLLKALIGPSGNLRAPTILIGKTMLVGFNEDCFREQLA